jgi:flavin reductase (DIM6/NTAB) family NADH-FMN oxidoreductase RutF
MSMIEQSRRRIRKLVFGDTLLPQEFTVGMAEPHAEIAVWLHGLGKPVDVTCRHSTACSEPFRVCIAFREGEVLSEASFQHLYLRVCEREGQRRVLGEIGLQPKETISVPELQIRVFAARSAANYCLPPARLGAHYLVQAYFLRRKPNTSGMTMSFLERRAAMVMFIRPHPVCLGSVIAAGGGNIFPMNLMGNLGSGYLAFALKDSRRAAHLVEQAGCIAISSVPIAQAPFAFRLAVNHFKDSIDWEQLPFSTVPSSTFGIPVPQFALRVRELQVERVHRIGSHTLFVARIVRDERSSAEPELCVIHGFYQAWRLRGRSTELKAALTADAINKGLCHS